MERTADFDVRNAGELHTASDEYHADSDEVDANRDRYYLTTAAGPFVILVTVIYVVFVIIVVAVAYS